MTTFTQARTAARALGWTIRRTGYDSEMVCYPVGTGADASESYFTDCPTDALDTVRAMAAPCEPAPETPPAPRVVATVCDMILANFLAGERMAATIDAADWMGDSEPFEMGVLS